MRRVLLIGALVALTARTAGAIALLGTPTTCADVSNICVGGADAGKLCGTGITCSGGTCTGTIPLAGTAWTNPTNAQTGGGVAGDSSFASATGISNGGNSRYLLCRGFGFSIDTTAKIDGVTVTVDKKASATGGTGIRDQVVSLVIAGVLAGSNKAETTRIWPTTAAGELRAYGNSLDKWGLNTTSQLIPAVVNATDFGVVVAANNNAGTRTAQVDQIVVTISTPPRGRLYANGFDLWQDGQLDGTTANLKGTASINTTAALTGASGLLITTTGTGTRGEWCTPDSLLDPNLADRSFARHKVRLDTTTFGNDGDCATIGHHEQAGNVTGCSMQLCRANASSFDLSVYYNDTTGARQYGTVSLTAGVHTLELDQKNSATDNAVACGLLVDGLTAIQTSQIVARDCSNSLCDLLGYCLGTPGSTKTYAAADKAITALEMDDFAIGNDVVLGPGRVITLTPNADVATSVWGSTGGPGNPSAFEVVDDWNTGANDSPTCATGTRRTRGGATSSDTFGFTDLSALATGESIGVVTLYTQACNSGGTDATVAPHLVSDGVTNERTAAYTLAQSGSPVNGLLYTADLDFGDSDTATCTTDADCTAATGGQCRTGSCGGGKCCWYPWTAARVNALGAGTSKVLTGNGTPEVTALALMVDVSEPVAPVDINLQDYNGDGHITMVMGWDSISAGTASKRCEGGQCDLECASTADCPVGTCGVDGRCEVSCSEDADCTCSVGAICQGFTTISTQIASKVPQVTDLMVCGKNGFRLSWAQRRLPEIVAGTRLTDCYMAVGNFGHCSGTSDPCDEDADCVSVACIPHLPDYVWSMGGANDVKQGPAPCNLFGLPWSFRLGSWQLHDQVGNLSCPLAATTPGPLRATRHTCATDEDCQTALSLPPGFTKCLGTCAGHSDPAWPCEVDSDCGECGTDASVPCDNQGVCSANTAERCDVSGDCPAYCTAGPATKLNTSCSADVDCNPTVPGTSPTPTPIAGACSGTPTCNAYPTARPKQQPRLDDPPCGRVPMMTPGQALPTQIPCKHNNCDTGTKVCLAPSSAVGCTTNADCAFPGIHGSAGLCVAGQCEFTAAISTWDLGPPEMQDLLIRQWDTAFALGSPRAVMRVLKNQEHWVEAQGLRYLIVSYLNHYLRPPGVHACIGPGVDPAKENLGCSTGADCVGSGTPTPVPTASRCLLTEGKGNFNLSPWPVWETELTNLQRKHARKFVDLKHIADIRGDRNSTIGALGYASGDGAHLAGLASGWAGEGTAGWLNTAFPVCSTDPTKPCGANMVQCSSDANCRVGTPTVVPGACGTPVAGVAYCGCSSDAQCGTGFTCKTVIPNQWVGAGTPTPTPAGRCVGERLIPTPGMPGNKLAPRILRGSDKVCADQSAGACSDEVSDTRCANRPEVRCDRDRDCIPTAAVGTPTPCTRDETCSVGACTTEAAFIQCTDDSHCRRDGYHSADTCQGGVCRQPQPCLTPLAKVTPGQNTECAEPWTCATLTPGVGDKCIPPTSTPTWTKTTTPTPTPAFVSDDFASLGGNWTQKSGGDTNSITGVSGAVRSDGSADAVMYYNAATFSAPAYAYGTLGAAVSSSGVGVCLGITSATNDAACCYQWDTSNELYADKYVSTATGAGAFSGTRSAGTWNPAGGDRVGIEWTTGTTYRCCYADDSTPTTWVCSSTFDGQVSGSRAGVIGFGTGGSTLTDWQAGTGALP